MKQAYINRLCSDAGSRIRAELDLLVTLVDGVVLAVVDLCVFL